MIKKNIYCTYPDNQLDKSYNNSKCLKLVREGAEIICSGKMFQQLIMRIVNRKVMLTNSSVTSRFK